MTSLPTGASRLAVRSMLLALLCAPLAAAPAPRPLYMPRSITQAYRRGTRSMDGRPGPSYWQNHGRYTISLTALPPDRNIRGTEEITYTNESPDTLRTLVFKLFMNNHKPGAPRTGGAPEGYLTSGVHIDRFAVNGAVTPWQESSGRYFTWQPVKLPTALAPHDSVRLAFDWHYELARVPAREGMIDSTTFYVAYFYPRVAVYDDTNGWDTMDFAGMEFYSDFNDYDVTVHVPAGFVVWGTGTLVNAAQLLQPEPLHRFQASFASDSTIRVATHEDMLARRVTTAGGENAWHFTARYVPDVAFGISDHYDWDAGSVVVDDATHRRASVQAAYNDTATDFHFMVRMAGQSLEFLSRRWPGVPYPYEKTTVFQGGAGMEYPMMANDESYADTSFAHFVAAHEIAHTYMPFYMGINETRYGFMDEGWATTFEYLLNVQNMGQARATAFFQQFRVNNWAHDSSPLADLPVITPEDVLKGQAYGDNAYGKPALGYLAMKDLLGDALFARCLHAYMDRWHGKHPTPWDFFYTFDDVSGQDLNWFWRGWFFENSYIDLAVRNVTRTRSGYAVSLENIGGMPAPVDLVLRYADASTDTLHETPAIWRANQQTATVQIPTRRTLRTLTLHGGIWVDADTTNDQWPSHPVADHR